MAEDSPPGGESCSEGGCCGHSGGSCGFPVKYLALILVPVAAVFVYTALRPQPKPDGAMDLNRLQQRGADLAGQMDQYAGTDGDQPAAGAAPAPPKAKASSTPEKPRPAASEGENPQPAPK